MRRIASLFLPMGKSLELWKVKLRCYNTTVEQTTSLRDNVFSQKLLPRSPQLEIQFLRVAIIRHRQVTKREVHSMDIQRHGNVSNFLKLKFPNVQTFRSSFHGCSSTFTRCSICLVLHISKYIKLVRDFTVLD